MSIVVAERSGRITLGTKVIKTYGKKFEVIDDAKMIILVPISSKTSSKTPTKKFWAALVKTFK